MANSATETMPERSNSDASASQDMFNRELETYRKIVAANHMFHQEVYRLLHELIVEDAPRSFRFLDIACGDASASAAILKSTAIGSYVGIDLSEASLRIADQNLKVLPCAVDLRCCDFAEAMANWSEPVDLIWIGMSLHHLQTTEKSRLMSDAYTVLGGEGMFVIWEPALLEGEDRRGWLARFSTLRPIWSSISDDEFASMEKHMLLADFPETVDTWLSMGRDAGFRHAEEIFMMPNRMGRVFRFGS